MELHVFARNQEFDEREEFDSQMKCFIREEYGHILGGHALRRAEDAPVVSLSNGGHAAVLEGARGLERFMAKYWGGLSDDEIDEDADTEMWVVARAATSGAVRRAA